MSAGPLQLFAFDPDGLPPVARERLAAHLSPEERGRYAALRDPAARARAEATRGALRELLGRELGRSPGALVLGAGPQGKPRLEPGLGLAFNAAHTAGLAVLALLRGGEVGVDAERLPPGLDPEELSPALAPAEVLALLALDPPRRARAALQRFVRKEALLKALGTGLGGALDPATLPLPEPAPGWTACEVPGHGRVWLHDLDLGPAHVGAVALSGPDAGPRLVRIDASTREAAEGEPDCTPASDSDGGASWSEPACEAGRHPRPQPHSGGAGTGSSMGSRHGSP